MYKFIDITEAQSDTTLPSEAISVNGEYIEELLPGYRTLYTEGRELLESELTEIQIGNQNGTRYQYKRDVPREITVHYTETGLFELLFIIGAKVTNLLFG